MRLLVSVCIFAAGAFAGFFLTALVRLTPSDWHYWVGARAVATRRQANIYEDLTEGCGGPQAASRFVVLRHLDAFLSVGCRGGPPE
jgi:hypothetical protein